MLNQGYDHEPKKRKGIRKRLIPNSLTMKLIFLCAVIIIVPYLYQSVFSAGIITSGIMDQYSNAMAENLANERQLIQNHFSNVQSWSDSVTHNMSYMNLLSSRGSQQMMQRLRMDGTINRIYSNDSHILALKSFSLFDEVRTRISKEYEHYTYNWSTLDTFLEQNNIPADLPDTCEFALLPLAESEQELYTNAFSVVWFVKGDANQLLMVLLAEIDGASLTNILPQLHLSEGEDLLLVNAQGQMLYRYNQALEIAALPAFIGEPGTHSTGGESVRLDDTEYRLFWSEPFMDGLRIVRCLPVSVINNIVYASQPGMVTMALLSLSAAIIALVLLVYRFTRPLRQLSESMEQAGDGKFNQLIPDQSAEIELQPLIHQFNTMMTLINQLFNETYRLKIEQQRAELKALQAQISPHFIYNTLQSIAYMAVKRNAFEISGIVDSLGRMLRYCLRSEDEHVTLAEEIENVEQYLNIQKMRLMDRISVTFTIDQRVKATIVPRMILQPLVENSVIHGMKNKKHKYHINICCTLQDDYLLIEVYDNGVGMNPAKLEEIQNAIASAQDSNAADVDNEHIGIINCQLRMKLFFQGKADFDIQSGPNKGTVVRIRCYIPQVQALPENPTDAPRDGGENTG